MFAFSNRPGMRRLVEREDDGNSPVIREGEDVLFQYPNIEFSFTINNPRGIGRLFVTSQRIVWMSNEEAYDFDVPYIILHAVSKDLATYPKPCIYCQLDCSEEVESDDEDEEGSGGDKARSDCSVPDQPTECFFSPDDDTTLLQIFEAFSQTAMLNPDPEEDEEDGLFQYPTDDFIYNEEEVMSGAQQVCSLSLQF